MSKKFFVNNIAYVFYFVFSIILELVTVSLTTDTFYISKPWFFLINLLVVFFLYNLISHRTIKRSLLLMLFVFQSIINLLVVCLWENTGTVLDFNMLTLIAETADFSNTVAINYWYIAYMILLIVMYCLCVSVLGKNADKYYTSNWLVSLLCIVCLTIGQVSLSISYNKISEDNFINSLYEETSDKYAIYGANGAFFNELTKMLFFDEYNELTNKEIEEYIYKEVSTPTDYFGVSKGNNLVTILVESFEWFSFISDPSIYPNGTNFDETTLDILYPNLRRFYNMSAIMNNHYSRNKTDISEDESLIGAYPSNRYINYGYPTNTYVTSIANSLKLQDETIDNNYFHNNKKYFYNRINVSSNLGYDNLYFIEEMKEYGVTNYLDEFLVSNTVMNKDSEMFDKMKDVMFPTDKRFNTHITTISMHGDYANYRENFKEYYDKLTSLNITIKNNDLKNYLVTVMDFDKAIGIMLDDLESKGLLGNTTIVMYADHNTYMSHLTNQIKNIYSYDASNHTELYRVPLMIYDSNISHQIINKFTTTYDIVPTVLDLFGIKYYSNLYYGNSIFSNNVSLLYTKAYDVFINDKILFSSIDNILYKNSSLTNEYITQIENQSKDLLKKIYYHNHIFYYDYFGNSSNNNIYLQRVENINK